MSALPEFIEVPGAQAKIYHDAPGWDGMTCAAIGQISFDTAQDGYALLGAAGRKLKAQGYDAILGPMDGDTWHNYRAIVECHGAPPFPMEPVSGPHVVSAFADAGFKPVAHYVSKRGRLIDVVGGKPAFVEGVEVAPWDGTQAEIVLEQLFVLASETFRGNPFFKQITQAKFLNLYRPLLKTLDPRHLLCARTSGGSLIGFMFGLPFNPPGPSEPAVVLKTYASSRPGIGRLLVDSYHRRAHDMGFTEMIHALMHEDNKSRHRSRHYKTHVFRRYALMGKKL